MDLFQRLLGTLQRTVDYISTFTTYLLGDEAHPGAEESGSTRVTEPCRSHHDREVETAHYGDISPRGNPEALKGPPIAERIPPSEEIQEASGNTFGCSQATETILGTSKLSCKDEGHEDVGRKLSEPLNFLADAPKPRSSTTGSILQRDLKGPTVTEGFHPWESEGTARMGAVRQELLEEMAYVNDWKPEKPLASGQEHEEIGRAGEAEGTLQREQKETEGDEQEGPGGAESDGEEQRGLNGAAWTGKFQHEVAKMAENLRSGPDGQLVGEGNKEDNQEEEADIEARDEGVQPAVLDSAESGGDKQGGPDGKVEARSSPQWEPEEMLTLQVQDKDPKGVPEKGDSQHGGLEGAEMEEHQQLEVFVRNEGTLWSKQEENEGDEQEAPGRAESDGEEQRGLNGAAGTGRFHHEVAKMAENLRSGPDGQLVGAANVEDNQQEEPDIKAGDEGVQPAVQDSAESERGQEGGLEGEVEARSSLQWQPEETVTLEIQEEDPKRAAEKGEGQQRGLEGAEMEEPQQRKVEVFVRNEGTQQREQEENEGNEQEAPSRAKSDGEEQRGLNEAEWAGRFQHEVAKMAENLRSEPDGQLVGGANMEDNQQEEPDVEAGDEGVQPAVLDSAEGGGDQEGGPEGEVEARSNSLWEPDEREVPGEEESVTEEQWGDGAAWTGRSQEEVAKMAEGQWLEAEGPPAGGAEAENDRQGEPDVETRDKGAQQTILDGAETGGDQQEGREVESEEGRKLQGEPEEAVTLEEHPERGNGQQQGLEGAEEREGHQHGKLEGFARSEEEEEREEQMGEAGLERDRQTDPEALVGITAREEVVVAEVMEEPEVQEPRETEGTEMSLLHKAMEHKPPVDTCCLAGAGAFPAEVPSLDTSAQKERVLLRRKSSIRRAPSLKRPRPPMETPPPQETGKEENSPSPPPPSGRPNPRHAGFGPMHPNMMTELQTRLRRPR